MGAIWFLFGEYSGGPVAPMPEWHLWAGAAVAASSFYLSLRAQQKASETKGG